MRTAIIALLAGAALVAGCGEDEEQPATAASPSPTATASPEPTPSPEREAKGTTIKTGDSQFGTVLFDGRDQAIYIFDKEKSEKSECYGDCAEAWPPVLTDGDPVADGDAKASLLGTTERDDGKLQVTYNGHPLYYYAHEGPNEVKCHLVPGFGGLWLAVAPGGDRVS